VEPASLRSKGNEALHCENDQTKTFHILTTGMFILIVKDPDGYPPERTVWIEARNRFFNRLRVLELVAPCFCANFSRLSKVSGMCQGDPG
jgi:hypothetical protein